MLAIAIECTNLCNRHCLHCLRDKSETRESISIELLDKILSQARNLGISQICLTGGEVAIYPDFEELVKMLVDYDLSFSLVTNGFRFQERMLPLLTQPRVNKKLVHVSFSLEGARSESHDALRGEGSFKEVTAAITLCRLKGIRTRLKSMVTNFSKGELTELALLGATLGAESHGFIFAFPTPILIREGVLPAPREVERLLHWVMGSLASTVKTKIELEGYAAPKVFISCDARNYLNVDYRGSLIFCCNLSHITNEDGPPTSGREYLADLSKISLSEGIGRHFDLLAEFVKARLAEANNLSPLTYIPCYWCLKYFGKLNWLKNYPESPWAEGVLSVESSK